MSEALHAVIRGPNFTGCGYLFDFTPAHQLLLLTGKTRRIVGNLTKPVSGMSSNRVEAIVTFLLKALTLGAS
jgi:hypothetical protein